MAEVNLSLLLRTEQSAHDVMRLLVPESCCGIVARSMVVNERPSEIVPTRAKQPMNSAEDAAKSDHSSRGIPPLKAFFSFLLTNLLQVLGDNTGP